jgi:hypothetical protein
MTSKKNKIVVNNEEEGDAEVLIKKSDRSQLLEDKQEKVKEHIDEFYKNPKFSSIDRPSLGSFKWLKFLILVIVFGFLAGLSGTIFIFNQKKIDLPGGITISIEDFFPIPEEKEEKNNQITVVAEDYLQDLERNISSGLLRIFLAKDVINQPAPGFLEQIYAPWQVLGTGVMLNEKGWLVTTVDLKEDEKYVVLDKNNEIFPVEEFKSEKENKVNFLKISHPRPIIFNLGQASDLFPGARVLIFDKFKNLHLTEVSNARARRIYQTSDLVRSTDYFSDYLRLNRDVSILSFPNGLIFDQKGDLIGLVSNESLVPAWHLGKIKHYLDQEENVQRAYLGIDYLNIEEAPGLLNPYFQNLTYGAIVYGDPSEGSPADLAGIKNADVIIKVDQIILGGEQELTYLVQDKLPGEEINLVVLRNEEEIEFNIFLEERKAEAELEIEN